MFKGYIHHLILFGLLLSILGCEQSYVPKPKAYPRIELPQKEYTTYNPEVCPFQFQYPRYAKVVRDSFYFRSVLPEDQCWYNIIFPRLKGTIYLSYKPINDTSSLEQLIEDAHELSFKHAIKAETIDQSNIEKGKNVSGLYYNVGGNAASNIQFYLTDSTNHFVRGALYFRSVPNADSLAPVIDFVQKDLFQLIATFEWKK